MEILRTASLCKVRDGRLAMEIDNKLAELYTDCLERPQLQQARTVTVTISITPDGDDPLEGVKQDFKVKHSVPAIVVSGRAKSSRRHRGFVFQADTDDTQILEGQQQLDYDDEKED